MTTRKTLSGILLFAFLAIAGMSICAPAAAEIKDKDYLKIRHTVSSLYTVQSLLSWFVRTQGERSVFAESYAGHEDLFSKKTIAKIASLMEDKSLGDDDRRALQFMKNAMMLEYMALDTAHFDDEINNEEANATVTLDWEKKPVPYRQIHVLMAQETNPERRQKLQAAQARVWKESINPIYSRQEERLQELAKEIGYSDYVSLSEEYRHVDLKNLLAMSEKFYEKYDDLYRKLLAEEVDVAMGIPVSEFSRADIQFLASVPHLKKFFPAQLVIPTFMYFIEGMGLDLTTASGDTIKIDDEIRPKKVPRAACYSITVPSDVRITVKPSGGISDFETFFHEGGHALHFANTTTKTWEFQQLGDNAVTEGFAIFFETVWGEYDWLVRYRELVKEYNRFQKPEDRVPLMTDKDMGLLIRNRVFWDVYMVRRYNRAKLIYETILHGGSPEIYRGVYSGQTDDPHKVYQDLFSDAYGFPLTDTEALRYRTDVDSFFYSADYARAFMLAAQLNEMMRDKFGPEWFTDKGAGELLKTRLWLEGGKHNADEMAQLAGYENANYKMFVRRMERRLKIADNLIGEE